MYYWNHKTTSNTTLEEELLSCSSVKRVVIASAFLSQEGIRLLKLIAIKYELKKENITLYLSSQFSSDEPHKVLKQLSGLCVTKILFDNFFHAKVYLLYGSQNKVIFGSSNFTEGGMFRNIEFNYIGFLSTADIYSIALFFDYCERNAQEVTSEITKYYEDNQLLITELKSVNKRLTSVMTGFTHQDDGFLPDTYNIDNYYFTYEDYETFFNRNRKKNDYNISSSRKRVQRKMLDIHDLIYPKIKAKGIAHHKRKENITSLIIPLPINFGSVGWLGVRYGKTPPEVDWLNAGKEEDDDTYGFQKHGCLQFSIGSDGFDINLFLAVRRGAIDRKHLHENLSALKPRIESELEKLKGQGMKWVIWNHDNDDAPIEFDIDKKDVADFYYYIKENDFDGRESYLQKFYEPDDDILKTKESIGSEIIRVMEILLPLYNTIVWRPKV